MSSTKKGNWTARVEFSSFGCTCNELSFPLDLLDLVNGDQVERSALLKRGNMILTIEEMKELLKFGSIAGVTATDPLLKSAKVMIYVNNVSPTPNTVAADLTEATWSGYARSGAITWALPTISNETQDPAIVADAKTFTVTTNTDPQTMFGYALVTTVTAVDHLLAVAPLNTPITPAAGTEIIIQARLGVDETANNPSGDVTFN